MHQNLPNNHQLCTHQLVSFFIFNFIGSNFIGSVNFIPVFVFLYLPKQAGGKCLVTLKGSTVRFNDTGKIGYFYCKFIFEKKSKILRNDLRHRRDNFFKMLEPFEKNQSLEKVRKGEEYYKDYKGRRYVKGFVKYKVTSSVLLDLFRRSYSVEGHSSMVIYEHVLKNYYMCLERYLF